jgi:predicted ATPase/DNA-binding winged helix-turn-helix (wHTH) protein
MREREPGLSDERAFSLAFGPYRLDRERRRLFRGAEPVQVGSRALEILIALTDRCGELVSKEELFARAWPRLTVEDSNLRAQIAGLRKALDEDGLRTTFIAAVPGRGYRFVEPVAGNPVSDLRATLPVRLTKTLGRAEAVEAIGPRLKRTRFVTIVGPGGIGKTTVAIETARSLAGDFPDGVGFVDSTSLDDPSLLPAMLATALGVKAGGHDDVAAWGLQRQRFLVVLDNCERVAQAAAMLCEALLKAAPAAFILTTSREPLLAEGESVYRLPPLDAPPASAGLTAQRALGYSAVQLFVERTAASLHGYALNDADAPIVADICRQLDGVALAIELAAGRMEAFGARGVAERLHDRLRLLTGGRRTALPRHRTASAALDWSYDALTERERAVLRRLSIFADGFTLGAGCAVASGDDIDADEIAAIVADLLRKSLVAAAADGGHLRYRLLETTRAYGLIKLREASEHDAFALRHANYVCESLKASFPEGGVSATLALAPELGNVRAAIAWCYGAGKTPALGLELTVAAIPLWFQLSATDECRSAVQRAIAGVEEAAERAACSRKIMHLYLTLGLSQSFTIGLAPQALAAWDKAFEIAESLGDRECQREALWGLWFCHMGDGEYRKALDAGAHFGRLVETDADRRLAHRLKAIPLHCRGRHIEARRLVEAAREPQGSRAGDHLALRDRFAQPISTEVVLAPLLWLQGYADQAAAGARKALCDARDAGHAISICDALAQAVCPLAIAVGDWPQAAAAVEELLKIAEDSALGPWRVLGACWRGALDVERALSEAAVRELAADFKALGAVRFARYASVFAGMLAEGYAQLGQLPRARELIDEAIAVALRKRDLWRLPELWRVQGDILAGSGDRTAARTAYDRALRLSGRQGALIWEIRAATSLARLQRDLGQADEARRRLNEVLARFTEGFATRDVRAARALLNELPAVGEDIARRPRRADAS